MNFDKLDRFLSLAANFGVIIGIIFIVVEIRQNNELLAAQNRYNRLEVVMQGPRLFLEDADLPKIFYETPPDQRTDSEKRIFRFYWANIFLGMEWTFRELPRDEVPIEKWKRSINNDQVFAIWDVVKETYDSEFVEYMESYILEM